MKKKIESIKGLFGETIHYVDGVKVGETWPGLFSGTQNHYDAEGHFSGSSETGLFAEKVHYDSEHHRVGESYQGLFGFSEHANSDGERIGESFDSLWGTDSYLEDSDL